MKCVCLWNGYLPRFLSRLLNPSEQVYCMFYLGTFLFRKHWHDVFIKRCVSIVIYETLQDKNFHLYINYRNSVADTATASLIIT